MTLERHKTWSRLLANTGESLSRFVGGRVVHAWDAQDLVQEVYLRLLRAEQGDAGPIRHPEAYLFTIAANLIKERGIASKRAPISTEGLEEVVARLATPCDAEASIDSDLRRRRLTALLSRLSPKCRAVLIMHYRDELPYREIAGRLSISTNMVKKYIVKGLTVCRQGMVRYE